MGSPCSEHSGNGYSDDNANGNGDDDYDTDAVQPNVHSNDNGDRDRDGVHSNMHSGHHDNPVVHRDPIGLAQHLRHAGFLFVDLYSNGNSDGNDDSDGYWYAVTYRDRL